RQGAARPPRDRGAAPSPGAGPGIAVLLPVDASARPRNAMQRLARTLVVSFSLLGLCAAGAVAAPSEASAAGTALDTFRAGHGKVTQLVAKRADGAAIQKEVDALLDYR